MEREKLAEELSKHSPAMSFGFWAAVATRALKLCGPTAAERELIEATFDRHKSDSAFMRWRKAEDAARAERERVPMSRYTIEDRGEKRRDWERWSVVEDGEVVVAHTLTEDRARQVMLVLNAVEPDRA